MLIGRPPGDESRHELEIVSIAIVDDRSGVDFRTAAYGGKSAEGAIPASISGVAPAIAVGGRNAEGLAPGTALQNATFQTVSEPFGRDAVTERGPAHFLGLDPPEISKSLPIFVTKGCAGWQHGSNPIKPETPKVAGKLAPSRQQPDRAEKVDRKRANRADGTSAVKRFVFDQKHPPALCCALQFEQIDLGLMAFDPLRCPEYVLVDPGLTRCGQDGPDFCQRRSGLPGYGPVAPVGEHPRAKRQCFGFFGRKIERGEMISGFERVTDPRFAAKRNACCDKSINVAVNGADRHFERRSKARSSADLAASQQFEQGKKAIGAACHTDTTLAVAIVYA